MVDLTTLSADVTETVAYLALPGLLWLVLFLVAWGDGRVARGSGFERRTFWLLLPVGAIASVVVALPFFGWDGDVLAINLTGGVFPIVVSGLFLWRLSGASERTWGRFFGALAAETAVLFALVVLVPDPLGSTVGALAVCVATPLVVHGVGRSRASAAPTAPFVPLSLALASLSIFLTFVTTQPVPGAGIESIFPYYLIGPVAIGLVAVPVVGPALGRAPGESLAMAYSTSTLGTLIGADVLRQPPLYGAGPPAFLEIGGAGLFDLLYLSGLLAAAVAFAFLWVAERGRAKVPGPEEGAAPRTPVGYLQQALELGAAGRSVESTTASARAAEAAALEARRWVRAPPAPPGEPWSGLGLPPWVEADHANLQALARRGEVDAFDAGRAWNTSRWLVRIGREIGQRRLATAARRGAAFGLDLAVTLPLAVVVWVAIGLGTTGGLNGVANSVAFNAAAVGYPAYAFVYLVVAEATMGTTLGKWVLGLEVAGPDDRRAGPLSVLVRNVPKLVPLELIGLGGAVVTALLLNASTPSVPGNLATYGLDALGVAVALSGFVLLTLLVGWAGIQISSQRQRVGDYLAGTWVLVRLPGRPVR